MTCSTNSQVKQQSSHNIMSHIVELNRKRKRLEESGKLEKAGKVIRELQEMEDRFKKVYIGEVQLKLDEQRAELE